jgi:hypothetical protein
VPAVGAAYRGAADGASATAGAGQGGGAVTPRTPTS